MVAHGVSRGHRIENTISPGRGDRFFRPYRAWNTDRKIPMPYGMGYRLTALRAYQAMIRIAWMGAHPFSPFTSSRFAVL